MLWDLNSRRILTDGERLFRGKTSHHRLRSRFGKWLLRFTVFTKGNSSSIVLTIVFIWYRVLDTYCYYKLVKVQIMDSRGMSQQER
jgi:hypothetical protein